MREFMHHFCFRCNEGKNICDMKARGFGIYRRKKKEINCSFVTIINQNYGIKFVYMGFALSKTAFNFIGPYFPNFRVKLKIERFMIIP